MSSNNYCRKEQHGTIHTSILLYLFCCDGTDRFTLVQVSDECFDKSTGRTKTGKVYFILFVYSLLSKLVTEVDKVLPSRREVLSDEGHGGMQLSSKLCHIGTLVANTFNQLPGYLQTSKNVIF